MEQGCEQEGFIQRECEMVDGETQMFFTLVVVVMATRGHHVYNTHITIVFKQTGEYYTQHSYTEPVLTEHLPHTILLFTVHIKYSGWAENENPEPNIG